MTQLNEIEEIFTNALELSKQSHSRSNSFFEKSRATVSKSFRFEEVPKELRPRALESKIKVKATIMSHQPEKFRKLMYMDNINPQEVKKSLCPILNRDNLFKAGQGAGLSGSFFFFSKDNKFIIKTLRGDERKVLLGMLDDFIEYLEGNNNQTLIAKVYGCYTIETDTFSELDVIVMQNTA